MSKKISSDIALIAAVSTLRAVIEGDCVSDETLARAISVVSRRTPKTVQDEAHRQETLLAREDEI